MKTKIQFKEEQSFKGTWLYYLVVGISVLSLVGMIWPLYKSSGDTETYIGLAIGILVLLGVLALFTFCKLTTIIDEQHIYYKFPPFINSEKKLSKTDIDDVYVRKYSPITEYGGWGYRIGLRKGKALNVSGNMGLQIIQSSGDKLLIGTKKQDELQRVVTKLKANWDGNG